MIDIIETLVRLITSNDTFDDCFVVDTSCKWHPPVSVVIHTNDVMIELRQTGEFIVDVIQQLPSRTRSTVIWQALVDELFIHIMKWIAINPTQLRLCINEMPDAYKGILDYIKSDTDHRLSAVVKAYIENSGDDFPIGVDLSIQP
jgi:hypothetical protein